MTDDELCKAVAITWVSGGGDIEGFSYCYGRIKDAITELKESLDFVCQDKEERDD